MDEFDKIRELSEDIANRKEPTFTELGKDLSKKTETPQKEEDFSSFQNEESDDAGLYAFPSDFKKRLDALPVEEIEEKSFASMKLHFIALGVFIGILIVVLAGFFIFGNGDETPTEIVTITATPDPVKVKPEQPGGMNIPDQDKMVYDRIRSDTLPTKVESLFPEPEQPVLPNILVLNEENGKNQSESIEKQTDLKDSVEALLAEKRTPSEQPVLIEETIPDPVPKKEVIQLPKKETVKSSAKSVKTEKNVTSSKGVWSAQLMSSSNKTAVEKAWPQILSKHKALLGNMPHEIVRANISGKGTFYRLRIGHFQTRDQANELCQKLKARKQDCVPAK